MTLWEGTAEVAHEVLIREWPTLRGWLDDDRRASACTGGSATHRDSGTRVAGGSDLYRGTRLDAAVEWAEPHRGDSERDRAQLHQRQPRAGSGSAGPSCGRIEGCDG